MTQIKALLDGLGCHGPLACTTLWLYWYFPLSRTAGPYVTLNCTRLEPRSGVMLGGMNGLPVCLAI